MTLYESLIKEIERLAELAQRTVYTEGGSEWEATDGQIWNGTGGLVADIATEPTATHMAQWDPAFVLRHLAEDRKTLSRHAPIEEAAIDASIDSLVFCSHEWKGGAGHLVSWHTCPEVRSLMRKYRVS